MGIVSSSWTFTQQEENFSYIMIVMNWFILVCTGLVMVSALVMFRLNLAKCGLAQRTENFKMIIHSGAFLIYAITAIVATLLDFFMQANNKADFYFHWLLLLIFGFASFVCLLILLCTLGTKPKTVNIAITPGAADDEDDNRFTEGRMP